jgi:hypothetical protein
MTREMIVLTIGIVGLIVIVAVGLHFSGIGNCCVLP